MRVVRYTAPRFPRVSVSPESTLLCIELLKRGWDKKILAERCGLSEPSIQHAINQGFPCQRTRFLVEDALGGPVFSTLRAWKRRKALKAAIGTDPYLMTRVSLQAWATDRGIPFSKNHRILTKDELIQSLAHHLLRSTDQK
jgi:hypothetical protein